MLRKELLKASDVTKLVQVESIRRFKPRPLKASGVTKLVKVESKPRPLKAFGVTKLI